MGSKLKRAPTRSLRMKEKFPVWTSTQATPPSLQAVRLENVIGGCKEGLVS